MAIYVKTLLQRRAAIIQIAYKSRVYVIQSFAFEVDTSCLKILPPSLKVLLSSKYVVKFGVGIGGDFANIDRDYEVDFQCVGEAEIGTFCKDRNLIPNGQCKLSDICRIFLKSTFQKILD
jgi:hypothetical protein